MAQVTKDMLIGQLLQLDPEYGWYSYGIRYGMCRMPIRTDGISGGGCYGYTELMLMF